MNEARAHARDVKLQITSEVWQAEQALEMGEVRYKAGVVTNLDLLVAHTSLSQARLAYVGAQYGYVVSRYALDRATGASGWESRRN